MHCKNVDNPLFRDGHWPSLQEIINKVSTAIFQPNEILLMETWNQLTQNENETVVQYSARVQQVASQIFEQVTPQMIKTKLALTTGQAGREVLTFKDLEINDYIQLLQSKQDLLKEQQKLNIAAIGEFRHNTHGNYSSSSSSLSRPSGSTSTSPFKRPLFPPRNPSHIHQSAPYQHREYSHQFTITRRQLDSNQCYRCGKHGHKISRCELQKYCPIHGNSSHDIQDCKIVPEGNFFKLEPSQPL